MANKFRFLRDKDVVLFPKKIIEKFVMPHRIWQGIQIVNFNDWKELDKPFWENYLKNIQDYIVPNSYGFFEIAYIDTECSPIETVLGWVLIYHGVQSTILKNVNQDDKNFCGVHSAVLGDVYHAEASLLQKTD